MVLQALSQGYRYGFDIMDLTGLPSGTVYPILRRLERARLIRSSWEDEAEARLQHRPPRRYYRLTASGELVLARALKRYRGLVRLIPVLKPKRVGES